MKHLSIGILLILTFLISNSCSVSYSFTQASVAIDIKSYTIYNFAYRAQLVNPTLSDYFTEKLRDKFTRQTSLDYRSDGGDLEYEGSITGYNVQPISIKANDQASENRLTVRIKVKFTNNKNHAQDFETEFSAFEDFSSDYILSDVEDGLVEAIVKNLVDEIYNKSVANW